ncbi:MAG: metallophosphatase family protein, partial [Spirochaetes bacterium]|nr:metallophosphatase family protein [Spirochaetota bacterium]
MKLALLADIHGNLNALRAVLAEIAAERPDYILVAGDLVGDCPDPVAVLRLLQTLRVQVVRGNRDRDILRYHRGELPGWDRYKQMASMRWTAQQLGPAELDWLGGLPEQLSLIRRQDGGCDLVPERPLLESRADGTFVVPEVSPGWAGPDVRVVHGSPFHVYELLFGDHAKADDWHRVERALAAIPEQILVCGHTHEPWYEQVQGKLIVNPGSVGVHFNTSQAAEYALLLSDDHAADGRLEVQLRQVAYDIGMLLERYRDSGLLETGGIWGRSIIESILRGSNLSQDFIHFALDRVRAAGLAGQPYIPDWLWDEA